MTRRWRPEACCIVAVALICATASTTAHAAAPVRTTASLAASLNPDELGRRADLTLALRYLGGTDGVPAPVRRATIHLPAGLALDIPRLRSCPAARLRARGPRACPSESRLGTGRAVAVVRAGSQTIAENVALSAFLGPPRGQDPTFTIFAHGRSPVEERVLLTGSAQPDQAPYGEQLVLAIPAIPTLPLEPAASIARLSLTVGSRPRARTGRANTVLVPATCPHGGFPIAAEFAYADGSSGGAAASSIPCPASARVASTVSLHETGHLHVTSRHEFTLEELGAATGTFSGSIHVRLTLVSTSRATAEVTITRREGSISCAGTAAYRRGGEAATFAGTMSITGGTGRYRRARDSGLRIEGTLQQSSDAITVALSGRVSD